MQHRINMINESDIKDLVAKLPECYQPIFNFRQLDQAVSRQCDDRLAVIRAAMESLVNLYGRPLRVLDLGCAQGFFSMSVADLCESVLGIDFLAPNIDVCNAARDAAGLHHVQFQTGEITDIIQALRPGEFDVVLGLSVFHHLCHSQGWSNIAHRLKQLASVTDVLMLELADANEPLYWASSLPADAFELVCKIGFIYPLGEFATHLGKVSRTLYFCSDRIWRFETSTCRFDRWTEQSHEFAGAVHQGTRRYFFALDSVAKTMRFVGSVGQHNRREFASEERFFLKLAPRLLASIPTLKLQSIGSTVEYGHIVTARESGSTLAEMIVKDVDFEEGVVMRQVLAQLVQLESHGLYHRDVRVWNILIDLVGNIRLLDPASISEIPTEDSWPFNIFASFLIFVGELTSKGVPRVHLFRRPSLSSAWLKEPYRAWFDAIWAESHRHWTFSRFQELLSDVEANAKAYRPISGVPTINPDNMALWLAISERLLSDASDVFQTQRDVIAARATRQELQDLKDELVETTRRSAAELLQLKADTGEKLQAARKEADQFCEHVRELEHEQMRLLKKIATQSENENEQEIQRQEMLRQLENSKEQFQRMKAELIYQQATVASLVASTSWRLTAPLRSCVELFRRKS